uniref:Neurensin 1-like n=1 Tax=Gasterosteus aculeatus aculeatus TaxID=481459 RepID=A0AAQ4QGW1_GASAC
GEPPPPSWILIHLNNDQYFAAEAPYLTSSGSVSVQAGSSCLQFGVRSYLHHFYEGCSSPARREKDPEDRRRARRPRSTLWWKSPVWKVYLALGLPVLTAGIAILSVGYSTPHRIESFGEGDLFFVDPQAVSFNRGLRLSAAAGIGLSCLGSALAAMGLVFLVLPGASLKERLFHGPREGGRRGESGSKRKRPPRDPRAVVTKPPGVEEGKIPVTASRAEHLHPSS